MKIRINKLLSILLSALVLFSVCFIPTVASADNGQVVTYYVKSPGSDSYGVNTDLDGTENKPFETVYDLITYLNKNATLGKGDVVNVCILQNSNLKDYTKSTMLHNITAWTDSSASNLATVPAHSYKIVLKSPEGQNNYLAFSHKLNDNVDLMLNGPTEFDNVTLLNVNNNSGKAVCLEGCDATFTENCKFKYLSGAYNTSWDGIFKDTVMPIQMSRVQSANKVHAGSTINLNLASAKLYIPTSRNNNKNCNYTDDVKIVVDNQIANLEFIWGNANDTATGVATFQGDLIFDIKAATSVTNKVAKGPVVINGNLQVIAPKGFNFDISALTNLTLSKTGEVENYVFIENATGVKDVISATETAGVFEVSKEIHGITITDNNSTTYPVTEGKVTLPAGRYEVSIVENRVEYYVKSPGSDNYNTTSANGSAEKPFETVADAITYVNTTTDYGNGDQIVINILQNNNLKDYNKTTMLHNITAWTDSSARNLATVPAHAYKIVFKSPDGQNNYLAFSNKLNDNVDLMLNGPTEFDNVTLLNVNNNSGKAVCLEGKDATFTENCKFKYLSGAYNTSWDGIFKDTVMPIQMSRVYDVNKTHEGSTINLNLASAKFYIPTSRNNSKNCNYTDDVKIVVNNPAAAIEFIWGNANDTASGLATFEGDLIFDIKTASKITNKAAKGNVEVKGNLQVLIGGGVRTEGDISELSNVTFDADKYWFVKNTLNNVEVSFTQILGIFAVTNSDAIAVDGNENTYNQVEGKFILPAGVYTVKEEDKPEVRLPVYHVKSPGTDNYGAAIDADGTKEKPFRTVYELVEYLNANTTFSKGEDVNVCILQRSDIAQYNTTTMLHNITSWTNYSENFLASLPKHDYTLVIKSPDEENNYLAFSYKIADNVDLMLNGPVVFDNITLLNVRSDANKSICLEGYDATFTENCKFKYLSGAYNTKWDSVFANAVMPVQMSRVQNNPKTHGASTIVMNAPNAKLYLPTLRTSGNNCTYTGDVNIIVDSANADIEFVWGGASTGKVIFNGNLNFDIKESKLITNTKAKGEVIINGALQVLIDDDSYYTNSPMSFENVTVSKTGNVSNYWHIRNGTNDVNGVTFTTTPGIFAIKSGLDVAATSNSSEILPANNKLTLTSGEYIVKPRNKDYVDPLTVGKMIYFKNGPLNNHLASFVSAEKGKKYILKYSVYSTELIEAALISNGKRNTVKNAVELLKEEQHKNYISYTYRISIPDTYDDESNKAFLGVDMPIYAEGYIFNIECYEEGDSEKKSAWANGDFKKGFDEWIWGWTVVWFKRDVGAGATEWTDGTHEIKLMKYDLSYIDALISDLYRDDGEWYVGKDVETTPDEELGYATLKGTYLDQNGEPLSNVKMVLKSEDKTYTAYTNEKGNFAIYNLVEGYYDLYYVNGQGEEVSTGFAYAFGDGDTVTINLTNDSSVEIKVSTLSGTIYTPQLKVVSGLKVYLRGFGETVTDKNGNFSFTEVPVGSYEVYTILEDGSEYLFRTVEIKENVDLAVKLKYDPQIDKDSSQTDSEQTISYWLWIVLACGALIIAIAAVIMVVVLKKKKASK